MNQRELEKEGVDLKLVFLLLVRKIAYVIIFAAAGAVLCGGIYAVWHSALLEHRKYEAKSKYYITFKETMEKSYLDVYYNGYTWNDLLSSDPIMGYAMTCLPEQYDRTYVDDCVEAEILSDVRVLTTTVTADTEAEVLLIQQAVEEAVVHFGTEGENLEQIVVIRSTQPELEELADHVIRAAATGAVSFAVMTVLVLLFLINLRNDVYLPEQFTKRYGICAAGIRLKGKDQGSMERLLQTNLAHLTGKKEYPFVSAEEVLRLNGEEFEKLRAAGGVILTFPQGAANGKCLEHALYTLRIQECPVICAVITDASAFLTKTYYRFPRRSL